MKPEKIYLTIRKFVEDYRKTGWITDGAVRRLVKFKKTNGFGPAFIKVGKRVLIDVNVFWDIVEAKKGEK